MNFRFVNLLGAPYRGGNVLLADNTKLLSPVGNRLSVTDLDKSETVALPFENARNIVRIALTPNGVLLLSIDEEGRSLLVNVQRRVVLHHFSFKGPVSAIKFSPDGALFAVGVGKLLQIWRTPGFRKEFAPFALVRTYASCHDTVTCLDWSPDGHWVLAGSRDHTARLFLVSESERLLPVTLTGHRDILVGVFFGGGKSSENGDNLYLHTVSRDGALFSWKYHLDVSSVTQNGKNEGIMEEGRSKMLKRYDGEENVQGVGKGDAAKEQESQSPDAQPRDAGGARLAQPGGIEKTTSSSFSKKGRWELVKKNFFMQTSKLTACDYHQGLDLLVAAFSTGIFGLYELPDFNCLQVLSISQQKITTAVFNSAGNWLAFGSAKLGQLLVWEWRSETYVMKQQGHYYDVNCLSYSSDSQLLVSGADDNKLKVWNTLSGFCFATFTEHTNAITDVLFLPGNHVIVSASLDGTVRAWDLMRYRNFRTFTTPTPTQFASLAADPSGELICASSLDSFQIYIWSMKTGRLGDVLSGHEGPVHALAFSPTQKLLASASWDKTVRLWDVSKDKSGVETFMHTHEVLTVAYRADGKQIACTMLNGSINFWDPAEGLQTGSIEGRHDVAGGRLLGDRRTVANSSAGKYFTTICYSADGTYLLAGGTSKYICMYDVKEQVLLQRFQISSNYSVDGVLDTLNSKNMTSAGPLDSINDYDSDREDGLQYHSGGRTGYGLPGTTTNFGRPVARVKSIRISATGRSWTAATTEGLIVYSMDDNFIFDPSDLDLYVTPEAVQAALEAKESERALRLALRLNEPALIWKCVESVSPSDIAAVAMAIPQTYLATLFTTFAEQLQKSPHLEFMLLWVQELGLAHGRTIQLQTSKFLPSLRGLQKGLARLHEDLSSACSTNNYLLQYLCTAPGASSMEPATQILPWSQQLRHHDGVHDVVHEF